MIYEKTGFKELQYLNSIELMYLLYRNHRESVQSR